MIGLCGEGTGREEERIEEKRVNEEELKNASLKKAKRQINPNPSLALLSCHYPSSKISRIITLPTLPTLPYLPIFTLGRYGCLAVSLLLCRKSSKVGINQIHVRVK